MTLLLETHMTPVALSGAVITEDALVAFRLRLHLLQGSLRGLHTHPRTHQTDAGHDQWSAGFPHGKLSICASLPSDGAPCRFPGMLITHYLTFF